MRLRAGEDGEVLAIHGSRAASPTAWWPVDDRRQHLRRPCWAKRSATAFNVHTGFDEGARTAPSSCSRPPRPRSRRKRSPASGFCALRRWIDNLDTRWLDGKIRRFQSYALMSAEPGHYGLGLDAYATWTSPSANTAIWSTIASQSGHRRQDPG